MYELFVVYQLSQSYIYPLSAELISPTIKVSGCESFLGCVVCRSTWERSQPVKENVTYGTPSLIGWGSRDLGWYMTTDRPIPLTKFACLNCSAAKVKQSLSATAISYFQFHWHSSIIFARFMIHFLLLELRRIYSLTSKCHYNDVIVGVMASQIVFSTVYSGADQRKSKPRVTGLCAGNSPVTG